MPQQDIDESASENLSGHATTPEIDPNAHILSVKLPNYVEQPSNRELEQLDRDTYFPMNDAIIIVDGFEAIKAAMDKYADEIKDYNENLKKNGCDFRIKAIHTHRYRHYTYYYFGNYIYELKEEEDVDIVTSTPTDTSLIDKTSSKKKKSVKKPKKETNGDKGWVYHAKFDFGLWHRLVGNDIIKEIGLPPKINFSNINFHIVKKGEENTNTIIMPYLTFMNQNIKSIFNGCAAYRLN